MPRAEIVRVGIATRRARNCWNCDSPRSELRRSGIRIATPRDQNCDAPRLELRACRIQLLGNSDVQLRENVGIVVRIDYIRIKKVPRTTTKYRRSWRKVETENKRLYDKKSIIRWSMEENWAQRAFIGSDGHNYAIMMRIIFAIRAS